MNKYFLVAFALACSSEILGQAKGFMPDSLYYPTSGVYSDNILNTGIFHSNEVKKESEKKNWFGLFKNAGNYFVKPTSIQVIQVRDPVSDKQDEKTGWEVSTSVHDTSLLLVSEIAYVEAHKVESAKENIRLRVDETVQWSYLGKSYKLYTTSSRRGDHAENFKMYISTSKGGVTINQLLVSVPRFYFEDITVLFAGDIDGDGLLDLIIDTTWKENIMIPTLYLSKPAGKTELIKVVGMHMTVGC